MDLTARVLEPRSLGPNPSSTQTGRGPSGNRGLSQTGWFAECFITGLYTKVTPDGVTVGLLTTLKGPGDGEGMVSQIWRERDAGRSWDPQQPGRGQGQVSAQPPSPPSSGPFTTGQALRKPWGKAFSLLAAEQSGEG